MGRWKGPGIRRLCAAEELKRDPAQSDRIAAEKANVDHKTVAAVRVDMEQRGEIPHVDIRTDSTGREQPARKKPGIRPGTKRRGAIGLRVASPYVECARTRCRPFYAPPQTCPSRWRTPDQRTGNAMVARILHSLCTRAEFRAQTGNLLHCYGHLSRGVQAAS